MRWFIPWNSWLRVRSFMNPTDYFSSLTLYHFFISMVTCFITSRAREDPMLSWVHLFFDNPRLNNKQICRKHETRATVNTWHQNEASGWKVNEQSGPKQNIPQSEYFHLWKAALNSNMWMYKYYNKNSRIQVFYSECVTAECENKQNKP